MKKNVYDRPIKEAMLLMTAPVIVGMLSTFLFQLVDTYFIAQLGTTELAAISFTFPVYMLLISIFIGIASGVSSTIAKAIGEKNVDKAALLTTSSISVFMLIALCISAVGYFTVPQVFGLLGAGSEMIPLIAQYMQTLYLGLFALVGMLVAGAALRAKGITGKPEILMGISGVINLVLDYLLIFGKGPFPAMGLQGAALATIISWIVVLILMIRMLFKEGLLSFSILKTVNRIKVALAEIFQIGLPAIAAQILNPVAIAVITRIVAQSGESAVAAYGIATRIETLGLTGILALSVILTPLVAQNYGAKQQSRVDETIALSGRMTVYWGVVLYIILLFATELLTGIFSESPEVIQYTKNYLFIVGITFPAMGLALITSSIFNGLYLPKSSLKLTLVKALVFTIPFTLVGSMISLNAVWIGLAFANIAGVIYASRLLNHWFVEKNSSLLGKNPLTDYLGDFKYLYSKVFTK